MAAESDQSPKIDLSVVIPVKNEAGNVAPLVGEIEVALSGVVSYEIIIVDDGSDDGTGHEAEALMDRDHVRVLRQDRSCGQSQATLSGVLAANGVWIGTIDGDGQNIPADFIKLLDARAASGADNDRTLFIGRREGRQDSGLRKFVSRIANAIRGFLLGDQTPDSGCGLKLIRRDLFLALPRFDALHRFMPALTIRAGGRVVSIPISHRPRTKGQSKYGIWLRGLAGVVDLLGVAWLQMRHTRPAVRERRPHSARTD